MSWKKLTSLSFNNWHDSDGKENIVFLLFILYYCYNKNKSLGTGFLTNDEAAYSD